MPTALICVPPSVLGVVDAAGSLARARAARRDARELARHETRLARELSLLIGEVSRQTTQRFSDVLDLLPRMDPASQVALVEQLELLLDAEDAKMLRLVESGRARRDLLR